MNEDYFLVGTPSYAVRKIPTVTWHEDKYKNTQKDDSDEVGIFFKSIGPFESPAACRKCFPKFSAAEMKAITHQSWPHWVTTNQYVDVVELTSGSSNQPTQVTAFYDNLPQPNLATVHFRDD